MFPSKCIFYVVFSSIIVACISRKDSVTDGKVIKTFPYRFFYQRHDRINMNVTLKNIPPNVTSAKLLLQYSSGFVVTYFDIGRDNSLQFQEEIEEEIIYIDVELEDLANGTRTIRLCEGVQANVRKPLGLWETELVEILNRPGPCFHKSESCMLELDLGYKYIETLSNVELIVIPFSVVFMLVLILQAIEAIRKHCRKKPDTANRPPMPLPYRPFYLNLLFQKECEREIREKEGQLCEENIYEEIDPF
ncbi:uncharacterized protein LOC124641501 [Helicoverpa zea]|uniref:uncharacterized protein LOC124641501 n=1 Tax=Helicoverpa zea TaxID=7113 RepID=UPI001F5AB939|nr:uncharacterized protein LOC124641501 [Helicoverpa zea]